MVPEDRPHVNYSVSQQLLRFGDVIRSNIFEERDAMCARMNAMREPLFVEKHLASVTIKVGFGIA